MSKDDQQFFRHSAAYRAAYNKGLRSYQLYGLDISKSGYEPLSEEHEAFVEGMYQGHRRNPARDIALLNDEESHARMREEDRIAAEKEAERQLKRRAEAYRRKKYGE